MKTRMGFVSNSSTSSFLIYGVNVDKDDVLASLDPKYFTNREASRDEDDTYDEDSDRVDMLLSEVTKGTGFEFHSVYDCDSVFVGRSWGTVGLDETGRQFRESVEEKIKSIFGKDMSCSTFDEVIEG
jgi:hypothetical protein